jgi:hypothetical protein
MTYKTKEALEFARGAIYDAISSECGLDYFAGLSVIEMIDKALEEPLVLPDLGTGDLL